MKIIRLLLIVALVTLVLYVFYWAIFPNSSPPWTGFGPYDEEVSGPRAKTLWDWMQLFIVPVAISISVWWLNRAEKNTEREIAKQKDTTEREISSKKQWQFTLEAYFDRMTSLLLHEGLKSSQEEDFLKLDHTRKIARTHTLAVMRNLDGGHKGQVIRFLYEAGLLDGENPVINIAGADLSEIDLRGASLSHINLSGVYLVRANFSNAYLLNAVFSNAKLMESDFTCAELTEAIFSRADLSNAVLDGAILWKSDFAEANLNDAKLIGATLDSANLRLANLERADLSRSDLTKANLENAKLQHAQISDYGEETKLFNANLSEADLAQANLKGALLNGANFFHAFLWGATLTNAHLAGANLKEARHINLKRVGSLHGATLPDWTKHDGTVILSKITYSHVLHAIKELDLSEAYQSSSDRYILGVPFVVFRRRRYKLSFLIPYAYESNDDLTYDVFDQGEAIKHLNSLGFVVENDI